MKTNRPTNNSRNNTAKTWYDLGYEDAVLDHDFTDTAYGLHWDKGWMAARDDMEEVMEIVHFCLQKDKTYLAKIVMEAHLKLESGDE